MGLQPHQLIDLDLIQKLVLISPASNLDLSIMNFALHLGLLNLFYLLFRVYFYFLRNLLMPNLLILGLKKVLNNMFFFPVSHNPEHYFDKFL